MNEGIDFPECLQAERGRRGRNPPPLSLSHSLYTYKGNRIEAKPSLKPEHKHTHTHTHTLTH